MTDLIVIVALQYMSMYVQLIYAIRCIRTSSVAEAMKEIAVYLSKRAGSILDDSALVVEMMSYAEEGDVGMLEFLYSLGAGMLCCDSSGRNILHVAVANRHPAVLQWASKEVPLWPLFSKHDKNHRSVMDEALAIEDNEEYLAIIRNVLDGKNAA